MCRFGALHKMISHAMKRMPMTRNAFDSTSSLCRVNESGFTEMRAKIVGWLPMAACLGRRTVFVGVGRVEGRRIQVEEGREDGERKEADAE